MSQNVDIIIMKVAPWSSSYGAREGNRDDKCKDGDNDYDDNDDNDHDYYDEYDDDRKGVM